MITVAATEFSKHFGLYREVVQREEIAVTSHDRITGYFVSSVEYQEYLHFKALMPKAFAVGELPEETIKAISEVRMDAVHDHLNRLLEE